MYVEVVRNALETLGVMRRVLLCMLEVSEVVELLELLEVLEAMRCVLLCILEAVEGRLCCRR